MKIIIIGGGIAGTACAEELRKLSSEVEIAIVSEEHTPLYSRILLPFYLKGKVERERVFLKDENWYAENNIEWLPGLRVEKIDHKNSFVELTDGRELPFDKLVIAGGRDTRALPEDLRGVAYLWMLDDADHLLQLISEQPRPCAVGVYGGGLIACEFINIFQNFNFEITVAFRGPGFWSRVLDKESSELINRHLIKNNIKVLPEAKFISLQGEKELSGVETDKENFACKILGVGIGLEPDISWLQDSGLNVGKGIKVNEKMKTNLPNIFAIGDTAEVFDVHSGHQRIMGTWTAAQFQGRIAAQNILGQEEVFDQVTSSTMNILGLDVIFLGDTDREWADEVKVEGSLEEGGVVQIFYKKQKAIGATLINRNSERARLLAEIKG
ncbi:MAG: FAD-dependent pyridine nucleotide-disulfide oxidoreductase [Candidatus Uhrbacteria bacterium GW2011_GWE2_45_35]|nr:MAG: FAD-dependent pyridine nucleotide-disulfide oxidoreductase [Candidatus Uhrbacteria bacterium GW2011_GWE2_45_35]